MGIVPLDILFRVAKQPKPGEKVNALSRRIQGGGPVPNTLVGLSRLGIKTAAIVVVGEDLFGRLSLDELRSENVDISHAIIKRRPSAAAIGLVEPGSGRRTIALERSIDIRPRDIALERLPVPRILHIDGRDIEACLKLARWARRIGAIVSLDVGSVRNDVSRLLPLVDHLVVADAFALPFTRSMSVSAALARLSSLSSGAVVITAGIRGAVGMESGRKVRVPAYKVNSVDTTGAGDAFHAGYLFAVLRGLAMEERLRLGAATAALKCRHLGARTGVPTLRELNRFLKLEPPTYA
jgi:ribokinase